MKPHVEGEHNPGASEPTPAARNSAWSEGCRYNVSKLKSEGRAVVRIVSNCRQRKAGTPGRFRLAGVLLVAGILLAGVLLSVGVLPAVALARQADGGGAAAHTIGRTTTASFPVLSFASAVQPIDGSLKALMVESGSWEPGDPVSLDQLRLIVVGYWGFDGRPHTGSLVVSAAWATKLCTVFHTLYDARFPIRRMNLVDVYGADDDRSMAADNTSAYNGRLVAGTSVWSMHAYGLAIDINPVENPYVHGGAVSPAAGEAFAVRSHLPPGAIKPGDIVVRAFAAIGWKWGGDWRSDKDYQHFSSNGR